MEMDSENIDTSYFQKIFMYTTSTNLNECDMREMLGNRKGSFFKSLRSPKFWLNFENRGYWKNYNTTAK